MLLRVVMSLLISGFALWAQGEAVIGPVTLNQSIQGVPVEIPVTSFVGMSTTQQGIAVRIRLEARLRNLQTKIGSIVDTVALPTDNCSHFGIDNLTARIWGKSLTPSGNLALLELKGDVEDWACAKNPIPCSKVVMKRNSLGFDSPALEFFDCNPPVKNKNIQQPFTARLSARVVQLDPQNVRVDLQDPQVDLGGKLGGVTGGILKIVGININDKIADAFSHAIDANLLRQSLPPDLQKLGLAISGAAFADDSGELVVRTALQGMVTPDKMTDLMRTILNAPKSPQH
jgi:hypothetical protein